MVMTRAAARPGDVVAVTGTVGEGLAGLRFLQASAGRPETPAAQRLVAAYERAIPQLEVGQKAVVAGVRCAIDLSDGLVQDLGHIARASGVAIRFEVARLPISDDVRDLFPNDALQFALTGGDEYDLILVAPRTVIETVRSQTDTLLTEIGEVVAAGEPKVTVFDDAGNEISLDRGGWDHFRS
jgi:thiamine-monophosphate kinase